LPQAWLWQVLLPIAVLALTLAGGVCVVRSLSGEETGRPEPTRTSSDIMKKDKKPAGKDGPKNKDTPRRREDVARVPTEGKGLPVVAVVDHAEELARSGLGSRIRFPHLTYR
jgi:hypothetical protein